MNLKDKIIKYAGGKSIFTTREFQSSLSKKITRQHLSRIIRELINQGKLVKTGSTINAAYSLPDKKNITLTARLRIKRAGAEEHKVFDRLSSKHQFVSKLPENINSIIYYVFTEMLNNAIEHSESKYLEINLSQKNDDFIIQVDDYGIGVFKNVQKKRKLASETEAMQDLLKGKTTTDPRSHSGEGIFFTSKIVDLFILESYSYRLRIDNSLPDYFFETNSPKKRGTKVTCQINIKSDKHLNDVFSKYVTNPKAVGFDKTKIKIHLYTIATTYISRSQARRVLAGLDKFKTIILDFDRVSTIGQAFADEIFRVFQERHPDITISYINTIEPVRFMINRTIQTQ